MIIPTHVAFIMDGNGRWAQQRGLPRSAGHKAGLEHVPDVLEICRDAGIQVISAYAWSTENWGRAKAEVDFVMRALETHLPRFARELHERNVRFAHSGSRENLSFRALQVLDEAIELTRHDGPAVFNLAFNYGGRAELVHAARLLLSERARPENISEAAIAAHLWTAGLPDVDLIIRAGGDQRLSNFMLWQSAYACVHIADAYWPEVGRDDVEAGIAAYNRIMA